MLALPNSDSEVVDNLKNVPGFELLNGPAGMQLGTDANSIPSKLGPEFFYIVRAYVYFKNSCSTLLVYLPIIHWCQLE